ncbi:hypothetical protein IAU59_003133 [Kwoniella sp. CBS 9459]
MIFVFEPQQPQPASAYDPNVDASPDINVNTYANTAADTIRVGNGNIVNPAYLTFTLSEGANVLPGAAMATATAATDPAGATLAISAPAVSGSVSVPAAAIVSATSMPSTNAHDILSISRTPTTLSPALSTSTDSTGDRDARDSSMSSAAGESDSTNTFHRATLIIVFALLGIGAAAVGWWYLRKRRSRRSTRAGVVDIEHSVEKRLSLPRGGLKNGHGHGHGHERRSWVKLDESAEDQNEDQHDRGILHAGNNGSTMSTENENDHGLNESGKASYATHGLVQRNPEERGAMENIHPNTNKPKTFSIYPKDPPPGTEMAYDAQPHPYQRAHSPQEVYQITDSSQRPTGPDNYPYDYGHSYASTTTATATMAWAGSGARPAGTEDRAQQQIMMSEEAGQGQAQGSYYNPVTRESMISNGSSERRKSTISWFPSPPTSLPPLPPLPTSAPSQASSTVTDSQKHTAYTATAGDGNRKSHGAEIGVATTTSMPASSSRSAVAVDSYPVRGAGSGKDLAKLGTESSLPAIKRQSLPYVLPAQEAERTPTFLSLSTMPAHDQPNQPDQETQKEKRHPTESLYVFYKDK